MIPHRSKPDLAAIRGRLDAVTTGDWYQDEILPGIVRYSDKPQDGFVVGRSAPFVAHSKQDVADLLDYIEEMENP